MEESEDDFEDITSSITVLEEQIEELDEDDISRLVDIIISFNWKTEIREKIHLHLERQKGTRKAGPGRKKKSNKKRKLDIEEEIKTQTENASQIFLENDNVISDSVIDKMKLMKISLGKIINSDIKSSMDMISDENKKEFAKLIGRSEYDQIRISSEKYQVKYLEDAKNKTVNEYFDSGSEVLNSLIEGMAEGFVERKQGKARHIPLWCLTVIEITDRIRRLQNQRFISPIGFGRNYFLYKHTGSR